MTTAYIETRKYFLVRPNLYNSFPLYKIGTVTVIVTIDVVDKNLYFSDPYATLKLILDTDPDSSPTRLYKAFLKWI